MSEENNCENVGKETCSGRRDFLVSASAIAGGVVLSLSGLPKVEAQTDKKPMEMMKDGMGEEVTLKLDDKSPLSKVGGSQTLDTKSGKVIVVRTGDMSFTALAAVCTHKGGPIKYNEKSKQFFCPWHDSKFGTDGSNQGGPAKQPLKQYGTQSALVVSLKA